VTFADVGEDGARSLVGLDALSSKSSSAKQSSVFDRFIGGGAAGFIPIGSAIANRAAHASAHISCDGGPS
jgi:hypothetical protein